jgi:uncharacterized damage-inducible protein DinB
MSLPHSFLAELEHEAAGTRRALALVTPEHAGFKPHPRSFSLGDLAVHVVQMHRWIPVTVETSGMDFAVNDDRAEPFRTTEELLARFDAFLAEAKAALAGTTDAELAEPWTLRNGEQVFFTLPKAVCLRTFVFNHVVHHRAQLLVYLRLLDIPIPGLYGPSADEGPG